MAQHFLTRYEYCALGGSGSVGVFSESPLLSFEILGAQPLKINRLEPLKPSPRIYTVRVLKLCFVCTPRRYNL